MGASGMGGGGKSSNFELNLVPFIDLLSTLICFLLITAVWQELDSVSSNAPPKAASEMPDQPIPRPPDPVKKAALVVTLGVEKTDMADDDNVTAIPHLGGGDLDRDKIISILHKWKEKYPDRSDLVFATDNKAKYKYLVRMMDIFNSEKFSDVGINLN